MGLWGSRRDALGSAEEWTDARPTDGPVRGRLSADEWRRRSRVRRRLTGTLFALVFLAGGAAALFARGGYLDRVAVEHELEVAEREFFERAARVRAMRERMIELREGGLALERLAREELDLVRPGEVTFLIVDEDGARGGPPDGPPDRRDGP